MPSAECSALVNLFEELHGSQSSKAKSILLSKAKEHVLNRITEDELYSFFVNDSSTHNFANFFELDVWTRDLDACNGIVEFLEPYDIIERILALVKSIESVLTEPFYTNIAVFLLDKQNKDEQVKHMFLKRLIQLASNEESLSIKSEGSLKNLLVTLLKQTPRTSCNYTKLLAEFICKLSERLPIDTLKKLIVSTDFVVEAEQIFKSNTIQSFRILELLIKLACTRADNLCQIVEPGFSLGNKIATFLRQNNSDVLSKLNCIELTACLVDTSYGLEFTESIGIIRSLLTQLIEPCNDPFGALLVPALVKLFAIIAKKNPSVVEEKYPAYFVYLFKQAQNEEYVKNMESINLAIETFSFLFESNLVKKFLHSKHENELSALLMHITGMLRSSINDKLRVNCLSLLSEAFAVDPELLACQDRTDEKWSQSQYTSKHEWQEFSRAMYTTATSRIGHESVFQMCLEMAKQPFADKRLSAQLYFKSLAQSKWGLEKLFEPNKYNSDEAFISGYLLNRTIELEKEGLESKYELIRLVVASLDAQPDLIKLVGNDVLERMKTYVQEGPFLARAQARVAFESN